MLFLACLVLPRNFSRTSLIRQCSALSYVGYLRSWSSFRGYGLFKYCFPLRLRFSSKQINGFLTNMFFFLTSSDSSSPLGLYGCSTRSVVFGISPFWLLESVPWERNDTVPPLSPLSLFEFREILLVSWFLFLFLPGAIPLECFNAPPLFFDPFPIPALRARPVLCNPLCLFLSSIFLLVFVHQGPCTHFLPAPA